MLTPKIKFNFACRDVIMARKWLGSAWNRMAEGGWGVTQQHHDPQQCTTHLGMTWYLAFRSPCPAAVVACGCCCRCFRFPAALSPAVDPFPSLSLASTASLPPSPPSSPAAAPLPCPPALPCSSTVCLSSLSWAAPKRISCTPGRVVRSPQVKR